MTTEPTPRDYYDVLGVKRNASRKEIKRAYRHLTQVHAQAAERLKEVQQAYAVLSDNAKRSQYDQAGAPPATTEPAPPAAPVSGPMTAVTAAPVTITEPTPVSMSEPERQRGESASLALGLGNASTPSTDITATPPTPPAVAADGPATPAPPSVPATPSLWPLRTDLTILGLLLILSFFLASFIATNSDLWLHLAVGKRLSEGKHEFGVDPFSWATEATDSQPAVFWVHHSWLYSWLVFQLYNLIGGAGLVLGKAILFTAAIALLCRIGWNEANRWFVLICLAMAALACSHRLLLQPVVVSFLFLAITLFILYRVGIFALKTEAEEKPANVQSLWWLPPLFVLWANLDHWFILGPIMLALCWAGTGLAKWYPNGNPVPGKTLGLVLGVGLLACLLNPHHVRVFELPPELAYLVLALTDPLGIPVPDAVVGGGRALKELNKVVQYEWAISTMSADYWKNESLGLNVAGLAVYPLLLLGLLSFTLVALVKPQANAPTLQVNRFLLWLVFGVLALALHRLIPFFVLIAAPLTAMTLGEFLLWQQTSNAVSAERRDRGLHMARFASVPFMLLLLFLAWPGSLHDSLNFELYLPRRVAWDMREDPSMRGAAESLRGLKERGECANAFNVNFDLANYLPWFAPDVKYFMDTRFSLYARRVDGYLKVRAALLDPSKDAKDWQALFEERKIDQAVIGTPFLGNPPRILRWWNDPRQWRQRYGDTRIAVFSWAGANQSWPPGTARRDWNRQAFGPVRADERPKARGIDSPEPLSPFTLYLDGVGPTPVGVAQFDFCNVFYEYQSKSPQRSNHALALTYAALMNDQAMHAGIASLAPILLVFPDPPPDEKAPGKKLPKVLFFHEAFGRVLDFGLPALPILMVRAARQAVAQNPLNAEAHRTLRDANQTLRSAQEDHWINYQRSSGFPHPSSLRDRVRQVQLVAGAYHLQHLQPDNWLYQTQLADLYLQQGMLDLALEHRQLAQKAAEKVLAAGGANVPKDPKDREQILKKEYDTKIAPLEQAVRARLAKWKEKSDAKLPLRQFDFYQRGSYESLGDNDRMRIPLGLAAFAQRGLYRELRGDKTVGMPLGLSKKSLDLLLAIDAKSLSAEEQPVYLDMLFELLLQMGRVDSVMHLLQQDNVRKALPELAFAQYQLLAGAALGDYQAMDKALTVYEAEIRKVIKLKAAEVNVRKGEVAPSTFLMPANHSISALISGMVLTATPYANLQVAEDHLNKMHYDLFNTMTLRGIAALESGDTMRAREIFASALKEAGTEYHFSDRNIARRYLELLNESQ